MKIRVLRTHTPIQGVARFLTRKCLLSGWLCLLLLTFVLSSCNLTGSSTTTPTKQSQTFTSASNQTITYDSNPQSVILRTFYGGALAGTLELAPRVSIYGDGSYVLGAERRGQLNGDELQKLLSTLVDTDGLLSLTHQQFFDLPDQNATYLELMLNGKPRELVYGTFGSQPESPDILNEYQRLGKALQAITEALNGATQPYTSNDYALFARQVFYVGADQVTPYWPLVDITLNQLATFECGIVPEDTTSTNKEIGCLKFTVPEHGVLLTSSQYNQLKADLPLSQPMIFSENGLYYEVTMRPLLPDEKQQKILAMFGGSQLTYKGVPLQIGPIPQGTPTP